MTQSPGGRCFICDSGNTAGELEAGIFVCLKHARPDLYVGQRPYSADIDD